MKLSPAEQFLARLHESVADNSFVHLVLSAPAHPEKGLEKVLVRWVELRGAPQLSFTYRYANRDVTQNQPFSEGTDWIAHQLEDEFRSALLCTTRRDWQLIFGAGGQARLVSHKPSHTGAPERAHDQPRQRLLDASARDWLNGLGIVDAAGKVRASMADKYRQIERYLEIFSHLASECEWAGPPDGASSAPITIADMGCGKGYLTFGVWHLFHRVWRRPVSILGVEARAELVAAANTLARKLPAQGLRFEAGTIASTPLPRLDGLLALHACNTATDDAICQGVKLGARLIVVAPCCHKELRPQLGNPKPFAPMLRHGIMAQRMAEWLTDGLRALYLEWAGYRAKVFEFVPSEHTPKNLMIAAIRQDRPSASAEARARIEEVKTYFGIRHHALDVLFENKPE